MYEHRSHRLLPWSAFLRRAARHLLIGVAVLTSGAAIGTVGYHVLGALPWLDAFLNASMILSGMGPVDRLETPGAKLFAALFALFSGIVFIGVMGLVTAPWVHRLLHSIHMEDSSR